MALQTKSIKGRGVVKLRSQVASTEGTTLTETETYTGPYAALKVKQLAVVLSAKSSALLPTTAGNGQLTVVRETDLSASGPPAVPGTVTVEVIWQELRKPVEQNPAFAALSAEDISATRKAVDEGGGPPVQTDAGLKLWDLLSRGTTEWSTGVPLVRRTTTNVRGDLAGGGAWFRQNPPVEVAGSWSWMKTADERRRDGKSYTQVEEWTAAEAWDETLYPLPA